jgi:cytochrome b6-f complex iron-sulfur subunit
MNRRESVLKALRGGTVLFVVPSVLQSCSKEADPINYNPLPPGSNITIDLSLPENAALNNAGGSKIVQSVLVANTGNDTFIALSSICTHEGCTVSYVHGAGNIQCPCHGSVYAKSGSVINGPAPLALKSYTVTRNGSILTIS